MKKNKEKQAYFVQRLVAYIIDIIIVSVISSLLTVPMIDNKAITKLQNESNKIINNYTEKKIDFKTYMHQSIDLSYEQEKAMGLANIVTIFIVVLYFVVYQLYKDGQTIGKKVMKIKILKNDDSELTMNDMIIRELINSSILATILIAFITLFGKNYYLGAMAVELLQNLLIFVTIFMIVIRKDGRGIPDMLANTKVINLGKEV